MSSTERQLLACKEAYLALLQLPPLERLHCQDALRLLCDAIAEATGESEQQTQDNYEALAYARRRQA